MKVANIAITLILTVKSVFAEDLTSVFDSALKTNPGLLAQASDRAAVSESMSQAEARFLPQLSLSANRARVRSETSAQTFGGDRKYSSHGYNLNVTQSLFEYANFVAYEQAETAINSAKARYQAVKQNLIVEVAERYFDFLSRQDDVFFSKSEIKANRQQLIQIKQRFELGLATITDVADSQAALDVANAEHIAAENALANSRQRLYEVSGLYVDALLPLKSETPLSVPEPSEPQRWVELALQNNPEIIVAKLEKKDAQQTIKLEKGGHYPSFELIGEKSYSSQSDSRFGGASQAHQQSLTVRFNIPIYSGGNVSSRIRQATHRLNQAMQREEQQRREIIRQSREAYNGVTSGISRVKALAQVLTSSQKSLEATEAGYTVGTRTIVDVSNARRDFFRAQRDLAASRYQYILSTLMLKQAAGTLNSGDLDIINNWLQLSLDS